jgi:transcription initiation factor TFIID subunit TAF12
VGVAGNEFSGRLAAQHRKSKELEVGSVGVGRQV